MTLVSAPPARPAALERLWWAARALHRELVGFRFDFPVTIVPGAGSRTSLHYYVYSERLFFDAMTLDPDGIPQQRFRTFGPVRNPAYVAWYGLASLERSLAHGDGAGERAFLRQVEWLVAQAVRREDESVVWPYRFDWWEGRCFLKAPWICAMAQGLAISALVRGYRLTGRRELLDLSRAATRVFEKNVEEGGVRTLENGHVLFEEYPGYPLPRVLDGFLFSLLGLHDLAVESGEPRILQLFSDGIDGLVHTLPFWDYRGKWSWYGAHGYLCPPHYNRLNCALLLVLARLSGQSVLSRYGGAWDPARLSPRDRVEVFGVFALTKNLARLRLRQRAR
jgi:hypothetical protein